MSKLNVDVIGVIMQYSAVSVEDVHRIASVNNKFHQAFLEEKILWEILAQRRWPERFQCGKLSAINHDIFRFRVLRERDFDPLDPAQLTEIENCVDVKFAFRCPMLMENLIVTPETSNEQHDNILYCPVCERKVYPVRTKEALKACAAERKCVVLRGKPRFAAASTNNIAFVCKKAECENEKSAQQRQIQTAQKYLHLFKGMTQMGWNDVCYSMAFAPCFSMRVDLHDGYSHITFYILLLDTTDAGLTSVPEAPMLSSVTFPKFSRVYTVGWLMGDETVKLIEKQKDHPLRVAVSAQQQKQKQKGGAVEKQRLSMDPVANDEAVKLCQRLVDEFSEYDEFMGEIESVD